MMINDCAHVGETLIKYLPRSLKVTHLKRSRRVLGKTFGIAWKILKAKGDVFHVHYLLQDCYLASKLGKSRLIGHAHGSDLRETINSRKWGWMVKHNLRNCKKILVAQPTILNLAREFNETAEYFPIPYDPELFYPTPLPQEAKTKRVFLASAHDFNIKGTDKFLHALAEIEIPLEIKTFRYGRDVEKAERLARELGLKAEFLDKIPHHEINELYWQSDLVLGSFGVGQLDTVAIEAMACGRPVVHSIRKEFYPMCPLGEFSSIKECSALITKLLFKTEEIDKFVQLQAKYVTSVHRAPELSKKLANIYMHIV